MGWTPYFHFQHTKNEISLHQLSYWGIYEESCGDTDSRDHMTEKCQIPILLALNIEDTFTNGNAKNGGCP
jgi:hypothetical protein